ncbi:hypothetical protein TVAG_221460 [Trichomonas vaginalis G3]|uniref:MI domain-containing protein n=1 Tax=Trichomonas vaginalis (strain ATCC PRA-98 / G3) TaxID=412133 RepID=A2FXE4_TRIV3|nr:armadillo (ARM) repeat-containing protein family [Trichomonas vaginalis G3]EAX90426.1 hypothetical protein TVAG_221460 [Trichomonas vaginalis G3]KAI5503157.1 armadillo (ARM) repeat-containing protein family [Trichomonas vaginalis G3]|eukprot:XP_001303356.1 hypothetical protein [Trichomonas vaginalis G3]
MSSNQPRKDQGQKRDNQKNDRRNQGRNGKPRRNTDPPKPTIEKRSENSIVLSTKEGSIQIQPAKAAEQQPHLANVQITKPEHPKIELTLSPEAAKLSQQRRAAHTYSIEEIKARRHNNELTNPDELMNVFQFHAELQLYKRFMNNASSRRRSQVQQADAPVYQHRINNILLQFNVNTFQTVFNELCSLGINSDVFVLSFVNVVFKHAVLNPPLAALFSLLAHHMIYVMKGTSYADKMRNMFLERCNESFVVPKEDTDKSTMILLYGIVTFAGHMIRDEVVKSELLGQWSSSLLKSGINVCLRLLIDLLLAGGASVIKEQETIIKQLDEKMKGVTDQSLKDSYAKLLDLVKVTESAKVTMQKELKDPNMKHSPSVDTSLNGEYKKLFKRSDSIPVDLDYFQDDMEEKDNIDGAVETFFLSTNIANFITMFNELGFKNDLESAKELLRAIGRQTEANQLVVAELAASLIQKNYFEQEMIKSAMTELAAEGKDDEKMGVCLAHIFALLVKEQFVSFDDFVQIFHEMSNIYKVVIPRFLFSISEIRGDIATDIAESEFWSQLKFVEDAEDNLDRADILNLWEVTEFFPQYDAFERIAKAKNGEEAAKIVQDFAEKVPDVNQYIHLVIEGLTQLPPQEGKNAAAKLKGYFGKNKNAVDQAVASIGDKAKALF